MEHCRITPKSWHDAKIMLNDPEYQRQVLKKLWKLENLLDKNELITLPLMTDTVIILPNKNKGEPSQC